MSTRIPEDLVPIADNLQRFIAQTVVPLEAKNLAIFSNPRKVYEDGGRYSTSVLSLRAEVRQASAKAGFYTMLADAELGGAGLGALAAVHLQMLLAREYGPERHLIHHVVIPSPFTNGLSPLLAFLPEGLKQSRLPAIASGEKTLCFALSEPDAGSDAQAIRTRAVRNGSEWTITGTKQWITNSPYADHAVVFARTDEEEGGGITAFFVDTGTSGFSVTSVIAMMGQPGGDTGIISLDGLRVPDDHRMGEVGQGLKVAMRGINAGRLGMAATCVGYAEWALAQATAYARTRKAFGKPIAEHQAIQFHLANSAMDVFAAKTMLLECAGRVESGSPSRGEVAMLKCFATEMLSRVMDACMQVHGAMGLTNELRLEAGYRFARMMRIPDGTAEIQRRTIAGELLRDRLEL